MFKEVIADFIAKKTGKKKEEILNLIEIPPEDKLGDYAFPCFVLAKELQKSPVKIAQELGKDIECAKEIEKVEIKGAYINFFIKRELFAEKILNITDSFGRGKEKEKIVLEHSSINPNASPHVGRTRNSIIGDSIYRLLTFMGNDVERHYYVNDVSKQVAILALNFKEGDTFDDLLKKYVEAVKSIEKNPELEEKVFEMLRHFENKDKKTVALFKQIVDIAVEGQKKVLSLIGINFDYFDYESRYIDAGRKILEDLEKTGKLFKDKEGRMVLDQKETGLGIKMKSPVLVLTRNDGTGLYPLRDLAYTIEKGKKGRNIIVLGEDQKLYFEQVKHALILLKKPYPEAVHYSYVLLKDIGKMSTRSGEVVLLTEFLEEAEEKAKKEIKKRKSKGDAMKIAIAAVKYSMLKNGNDKNIIFDLEQSLNFEGDSGPYLQYSYARACSILRKTEKEKSVSKIKIPKLNKSEVTIIKKISEFPGIAERAEKSLAPGLIANYAFSLAQIFNEFYHNCKVIGNQEEDFRLRIVKSFRTTMKNCLWLLGIDAIEEM